MVVEVKHLAGSRLLYSLGRAKKLQGRRNDYSWHFGPRAWKRVQKELSEDRRKNSDLSWLVSKDRTSRVLRENKCKSAYLGMVSLVVEKALRVDDDTLRRTGQCNPNIETIV